MQKHKDRAARQRLSGERGGGGEEKEGERAKQTDKSYKGRRPRQRHIGRETGRQGLRHSEKERETERERHTHTHTDRQRHIGREREKERESESEGEREMV